MSKWMIALLVLLGLAGVMAAREAPEIRRYMKIRRM